MARLRLRHHLLLFWLYGLSAWLLFYRDQVGIDGIAYVSNAAKFASGHFWNGVSAYWGPLISWLIAPFLVAGVPSLYAAKLCALLISQLLLMGVWLWARRFELSVPVRNGVMLAAAAMTATYAVTNVTSDLPAATVLVFYLYWTYDRWSARDAAVAGLLGFVGYLARPYLLPFFVAHFTLWSLYRLRGKGASWRETARCWLVAMGVCAILTAGWVGVLYKKYGVVMLTSTSRINHALVGPRSSGYHAHHTLGFLPLPDPQAVTPWDDPTVYPAVNPDWSALESRASFFYQLAFIRDNVGDLVVRFLTVSYLALPIIFFAFYVLLRRARQRKLWRLTLFFTGSAAIYCAGYLPLGIQGVQPRYIWGVFLLVLLLAGAFLQELAGSRRWTERAVQAAAFLLAVSFTYDPVLTLKRERPAARRLRPVALMLKEKFGVHGHLAFNAETHDCMYIAFYMGAQCVGRIGDVDLGIKSGELTRKLERVGADYYLVWRGKGPQVLPGPEFKEITAGALPGLLVFRREPSGS